jgi:type II secretory pathway predicted ATPase ExeA
MIRGRSRKLLSRILWIDAGEEADPPPVPLSSDPVPALEPEGPPPAGWFKPLPETSAGAKDIYTEHFGLTARPFALTPDPDFLFWPVAHRRAYTMLEYGISTHAPITLITGEVGAGKTTLLLHLVRSLGPEVRVGLISNPNGSRAELLRWVLMSLEQPAGIDESYVDLFSRFQTYVITEYALGRRVVLIFDEAQNLSAEALEELRMFININSGKDEVLQLVLIGQPELRDLVSKPGMRQFAQRIAASYHLAAMDLKTVRAYVAHRLAKAGAERKIFSPSAVRMIYDCTGGVPRLVNQLCDLSLVYAFSKGRKNVGTATVQQVLDDGVFFAVQSPNAMNESPAHA